MRAAIGIAEQIRKVGVHKVEIGSEQARAAISRLSEVGSVGKEVVDAIFDGEEFAPYEGYLFDYKEIWPSSKIELKKTVRHIAAFHNVFGGYIFFGVQEAKAESSFVPVLSTDPDPDLKQLKDVLREHLSTPIEVAMRTHVLPTNAGDRYVCALHIPKRAQDLEPVTVVRGALDDKSRPILEEGAAYLRDGDNSIPADKSKHWRTIYGARKNPYLREYSVAPTPLGDNLPDRSLIYRKFFGRDAELAELWRWFSDDFSKVRVLAGEGGLGKTSIAYEFASDVSRTAPLNFDSVVWLTAKQRQFRGLTDTYDELGLDTFDSIESMLRQIGESIGLTAAEVSDASESQLLRLVKRAASTITALVVIDDLDSLELDGQKRAIEICQQFSGSHTRFLFTTRNNVTASTASSIEIRGFDKEELALFANSWCERLKINALTTSELQGLHSVTGGSPLFVESVLRLLKAGMPVDEALKQWKGHLGVEVRNAALRREVMQLHLEARKMLVVVATLGSCSFAEVKTLLGFSDQTVIDAANGLQSLFLIDSPPIAKTPRYAVSSTTRLLVQSLGNAIIPEYGDLVKSVREKKYRHVDNNKTAPLRSVAAAINQAMAQMAENHFEDAVKTVNEVNERLGGSNSDLLSVRARALAKLSGTPVSTVRKAFEVAYDAGQRKEVFFDCWFNAEIASSSFDRAIEVIDRALKVEVGSKVNWLLMRLEARRRAAAQHVISDAEHAAAQVRSAYDDVRSIYELSRHDDDELARANALAFVERFADLHWQIMRPASDLARWLDALERQLDAIDLGDPRGDTYLRAAAALVGLKQSISSERDSARSVFEKQLRRVLTTYRMAPHWVARDAQFKGAQRELEVLAKRPA